MINTKIYRKKEAFLLFYFLIGMGLGTCVSAMEKDRKTVSFEGDSPRKRLIPFKTRSEGDRISPCLTPIPLDRSFLRTPLEEEMEQKERGETREKNKEKERDNEFTLCGLNFNKLKKLAKNQSFLNANSLIVQNISDKKGWKYIKNSLTLLNPFQLEKLTLTHNTIDTNLLIDILYENPMRGLTEIFWDSNEIGQGLLEFLFFSFPDSLESISFSGNFKEDGLMFIKALATSPLGPLLRSFSFIKCPLGSEEVELLTQINFSCEVKELSLLEKKKRRRKTLSIVGGSSPLLLRRTPPHSPPGSFMEGGIKGLFRGGSIPTKVSLPEWNQIAKSKRSPSPKKEKKEKEKEKEKEKVLPPAPSSLTSFLQILILRENSIGPWAVKSLMESHKIFSLKVLDLSSNPIGHLGVKYLTGSGETLPLEDLILAEIFSQKETGIPIQKEMKKIVNTVKDLKSFPYLRRLDLSRNLASYEDTLRLLSGQLVGQLEELSILRGSNTSKQIKHKIKDIFEEYSPTDIKFLLEKGKIKKGGWVKKEGNTKCRLY
jgi:hypothetical protein